jgi:hypothetical protein
MTIPKPVANDVRLEISPAGANWTDLSPDLVSLRFARGSQTYRLVDDLEVGELEAVVVGAAWTPAARPDMRAGSHVRVRGRVSIAGSSTWLTVWRGVMKDPVTTLTPRTGVAATTISAVDVLGVGDQNKAAGGMTGTSTDSRMGYAGNVRPGGQFVARNRIGADDTAHPAAPLYVDRDHTQLDQWRLIRDTRGAWLWASREQLSINFRTVANRPAYSTGSAVYTFTDSDPADTYVHHYLDLELTHDADNFTTAVSIEILGAGEPPFTTGTYGPYRDQTALDAGYGRRDETISVTDLRADGNHPATKARDLLRRRPLPSVTAKTVKVDVMRNSAILLYDLIYQLVRVKNAPTAHDARYWVLGEEHELEGDRWHVTYHLKTPDTLRTITVTEETS